MKRIIVCADGTWNVRDQIDSDTGKRRPTNVTKFARAVLPRDQQGVHQLLIYHDGVGTRGPLDQMSGGAFGRGIEENIQNLYRSILYNYSLGDEIYLIGFSRGAFTVRSLAGLMNRIGLLEKDDDYYMPEIYACYEGGHLQGSKEWDQSFRRVKGTRNCPQIKFIGVWDTVGALGAPGMVGRAARYFSDSKYGYHDVGLNSNIENAFQALAIDEEREPFKPSLWTRPSGWSGNLEQAWFAGAHCNVGGGYTPDGLANEALHWIAEKAESLGLALDSTYLSHFRPCFNSMRHNSMTPAYRLFGKTCRTIGAHLDHGEVIHKSAVDRMKYFNGNDSRDETWSETYKPRNLAEVLSSVKGSMPIVNTLRIQRGQAC